MHWSTLGHAIPLLVLILLTGCPEQLPMVTDAGDGPAADQALMGDLASGDRDLGQPSTVNRDPLDVVFVVEKTSSSEVLQQGLGASMDGFVEALQRAGFGSLRFVVLTSDMGAHTSQDQYLHASCSEFLGDRGEPTRRASCPGTVASQGFVEIGGASQNQASLTALRCLINVGTGCVASQPLWAIHNFATLGASSPLRYDAHLLVVVINALDDCSAADWPLSSFFGPMLAEGTSPVFRCAQFGHYCKGMDLVAEPYSAPLLDCRHTLASELLDPRRVQDRILSLRRDPWGVFVAAIAGWPNDGANATYSLSRDGPGQTLQLDPICTGVSGAAQPALRLKYFTDLFGEQGALESICDSSFAPALERIAGRAAAALGAARK